MKQYRDLVEYIMKNGTDKEDRTGTGTRSIFGYQMRFDLSEGFPLLTLKRTHWKSVAYELLWMIRGDTNVEWLHDHGVTIWDEWRRPYNLLRPVISVKKRKPTARVEYTGDYEKNTKIFNDDERNELFDRWKLMLRRCYDLNSSHYHSYGALGCSVDSRWHVFNQYVEDVKRLPHWWYAKNDLKNFDLDKDYYGAFQYGPDTSLWLKHDENIQYMKTVRPIKITDESGISRIFISGGQASKYYGISTSTLHRFLHNGHTENVKGENKKYKKWKFEYMKDIDGHGWRLETIEDGSLGPIYGKQWRNFNGIDQLAEAINTIKTNPDSRRIIVSAWNPGEIDRMALPPCHAFFQFYVANGKLSCHLYQRSADVFLGVPFNIASYSLLTHMVAKVTNLEVGEFVHTFGDAHIYKNHFDQVAEMLARSDLPLPTLRIEGSPTVIDDISFEDIILEGYQPHSTIKAPVAV